MVETARPGARNLRRIHEPANLVAALVVQIGVDATATELPHLRVCDTPTGEDSAIPTRPRSGPSASQNACRVASPSRWPSVCSRLVSS